jgi:geranylgeranyl transferase type-2 subunit alpha
MGAQSSSSGRKAMGNVPHLSGGHQRGDGGDDEEFNNIAKSIIALSPEELNSILINEWNFTTSKIHDNFSNGSAFHYRSKLLPLILESRLMASSTASLGDEGNRNNRYDAILTLAREEWESILLNAIFTEPDDQTPWWYHRFIVSWMKPSSNSNNDNINKDDDDNVQECEKLLYEMADSLRELLEVEKENDVLLPLDGDDENINNKDESKGSKCKWAYIG